MHDSVLWASLASLLCFNYHVSADYANDYSRLCPGNNPVKVGTEEYTVSCDRTLAPSLPVQKLAHIQDPTPEECAQACEQDRSNCFSMIWSDNACFQSSDPNDTQFKFVGGVVLTPPAVSGKTPEQWQQEVDDCTALKTQVEQERANFKSEAEQCHIEKGVCDTKEETCSREKGICENDRNQYVKDKKKAELERDDYKKKLEAELLKQSPPAWGPNKLNPDYFQCLRANDGKTITVGGKRYRIVYEISCDRTLAPSLPVKKLAYIRDPTPEECARVCEQDRSNCFGMIWSENACFQSSDPNDTQFKFVGGVVLTPPPVSRKTPEQWQQEVEDCEAKRDEYKTKLADEISGHAQKIKQMEKDYCLFPSEMRNRGRTYDSWKHSK
ncbi:hypothetical protein BDV33DRAFT_210300 [Aspergillus novoparasiticus]|uniref:Apple domain-containing protein n=1 Tax=Aspergillus novoparasiticus TaxID=986946 RepID=A0A5N6E971_9EURO|nr:hypothetical protein BDV33DRAFT_210300 [Aspergillus novoparasiticus]